MTEDVRGGTSQKTALQGKMKASWNSDLDRKGKKRTQKSALTNTPTPSHSSMRSECVDGSSDVVLP